MFDRVVNTPLPPSSLLTFWKVTNINICWLRLFASKISNFFIKFRSYHISILLLFQRESTQSLILESMFWLGFITSSWSSYFVFRRLQSLYNLLSLAIFKSSITRLGPWFRIITSQHLICRLFANYYYYKFSNFWDFLTNKLR